jgi:hypothetical protein
MYSRYRGRDSCRRRWRRWWWDSFEKDIKRALRGLYAF